jgi:hypothetical protein
MKKSQYGPCGLYCGACGALDCDGCRSDRVDDWVKQCPFRQCAKEKKLDFCCFCRDYPCKALHEFMHDKWPHHWTMQPNLEYIKKNGVAKWLLAQEQEWSCKSCTAAIHWYQKQCRCGQQLEAWELPT